MKRIGFLWDQICSMENIQEAITKSSKHKRKRKAVKRVLYDRDFYANEIHLMLVNKDIKWGEDHYKKIVEPSSKKIRDITIPTYYPDQIIHWCIILVIEKYIRKGMCDCCIGSVPKRGPVHGKKKVEKWLKNDKRIKYIDKADIHHFFNNIDVNVMKLLLRRDFKDPHLLEVLDYILDKGSRFTGKGLPIGYYTSQWLSNYYLEHVDHVILDQLRPLHYIRYVDDIVIFESNKRKLRKIHNRLSELLLDLKLNIKGNWQIFRKHSRALDFLGFRFFKKYTTLRKRLLQHILKVAARFSRQRKKAIRTARSLASLYGWFKHIDNGFLFYDKCLKAKAPIGLISFIISKYDKMKLAKN